jgi:hypothetical protein
VFESFSTEIPPRALTHKEARRTPRDEPLDFPLYAYVIVLQVLRTMVSVVIRSLSQLRRLPFPACR